MAYADEKNEEFLLNFQGQSKYWTVRDNKVNKNTTIHVVKALYKVESGVDSHVDSITLFSKAKVLANHKTLGDYGITNEQHLITVRFTGHASSESDDFSVIVNHLKNKKQAYDHLQNKFSDLQGDYKYLHAQHEDINCKYDHINKWVIENTDYRKWDSDIITNWIISLHKDYEQYETSLREKLREEQLTGTDVAYIDKNDLDRFGVKTFKHKREIITHIQKLTS
eukprot:206002_1